MPGASLAEIIERCQAYKAEAQADVICPNGLRTWEEIQEAIRLIPGPTQQSSVWVVARLSWFFRKSLDQLGGGGGPRKSRRQPVS